MHGRRFFTGGSRYHFYSDINSHNSHLIPRYDSRKKGSHDSDRIYCSAVEDLLDPLPGRQALLAAHQDVWNADLLGLAPTNIDKVAIRSPFPYGDFVLQGAYVVELAVSLQSAQRRAR